MSRQGEEQERPCLHCMMVELIDDFFAEYPAAAGSDKVDTGERDRRDCEDGRRTDESAGWYHPQASDRAGGTDPTLCAFCCRRTKTTPQCFA